MIRTASGRIIDWRFSLPISPESIRRLNAEMAEAARLVKQHAKDKTKKPEQKGYKP